MAADPLSPDVLGALRALDTPTVCNALEIAAPHRRAYGYTTSPLVCPNPDAPPMVGYARTGTIRANAPSGRSGDEDLAVRVGYYRHMAEAPQPTITVISDIDASPGYGAWWGEVNSSIHAGLGSLGVITNGSIRDLGDWAPGFGALAGSIGPSHAWVHVVEYAVPVTVHGMSVRPGDLIHADRHGAVVVPTDVAADVPEAAAHIAAAERILIDAARGGGFTIDQLTSLLDPKGDH
ncbi:RraA family protein [Candidatus Poriferisodalis sp.]|uniref:RraA family protein n=1 Tax=Candidatus Poriferisodalis sp. TaxID=3101277 RepID=UPI003AF4C0BB